MLEDPHEGVDVNARAVCDARRRLARRRVLTWAGAVAAVGPALAASAAWAASGPTEAGAPVAWPAVTLLDGTRWSAQRVADQAVVVVFWSLHCPYCVRHNARVEQLRASAAGMPLAILTACRENDEAGVRRHLAQHGLRFDVTLQSPALAAVLSPRRLSPLTVTIDRQGRLLQVIPGEMAEDDVMALKKLAA